MHGAGQNDAMPGGVGGRFTVASWVVDVRALEMASGDRTRKLEPKVMELLVCLARRPDETITRDELQEAVWPGVLVGYDSLTTAVIKLRKAFGDDPRRPKIVKTVPKVGYRLIADVEWGRQDGRSRAQEQADDRAARRGRSTAGDAGAPDRAAGSATRWPTIGAAALALLFVGIGAILWKPWVPEIIPARAEKMRHPLPGKPSIAVLAFKNHSEDSKQESLSDAMAEIIITELSRFRELFVIARNSSFKYKGKSVDTRTVAEDLGVRYVLEGSLQKRKDKLRVTVQLIDAVAGSHVWAEKYNRDVKDIFKIQDDITRRVVVSVARAIELKELDRIQRKHPASLAAYEYYLKGDEAWRKWTKEDTAQALQLFNKALELDPNLARGYFGRANVYLNNYRWGWGNLSREEALKRAIAAARKAVELDPLDWHAHHSLAYILMRSGDLEKAEAGFQKAREVNPNAVAVLVAMTEMRYYQGRYKEAINLMKEAMRLNPHHPDVYHSLLADAYWLDGQNDEALASLNRMTGKKPHFTLRVQAMVYANLGRFDDARATMREYLASNPKVKTLSQYRRYLRTLPWKDPGIIDRRVIPNMRKAGMPE